MYRMPSRYCTRPVSLLLLLRSATGRKPPGRFNCEMHSAEITNDSALNANATLKPYCAPTAPRNAPAVRLAHDVVCVIVFAVCSSSGVAILGRIELRPAGEERRCEHQRRAEHDTAAAGSAAGCTG